ncbi:restriction endonuclease subunit S [Escherichia coli]|nr:restriction endonuclease subunit S [Escherichia coli]
MSFDAFPVARLKDLVEIKSGRLNSSDAVADGEFPFFTCSKEILRINHYEHDREAVLLGGNNANAVFPVFYFSGKFTARQRVYIIWSLDDEKLSNIFLYYFLVYYSPRFKPTARGTTTLFITLPMLQALEVPLPPRSEQYRIASLLRGIDDRITLLRETNTTLEAISQALFKSWFVDFDPVRAKASGLEPESMDEANAALFPDSFEESELGLVPRGWMVRSLDSIANYLNGLALQRFPPTDDAWLPVIKIAQLRKGDTVGADRASRNIKPEYIIQNGDVLFSWSGSLEVVIWCGGEGALNQHLFKVTSKDFPKWFYYLWTRQHLADFQHTAASKATTMGHIQRKHLTEAKVVVPSAEVLRNAGVLIEPLLKRWLVNAEKAHTLTQLRDTLLPRLISGQLRLPEMEASVEAMLSEAV